MDASRTAVLAGTRTVAGSAVWNLIGRAGPILVAFAATPALVHLLGPSRWGVFTIALSLVGIFGIFDFGIGRALTRAIAEHVATGQERQAASLAVTGILVLASLGALGALVLAALARTWVGAGMRVPPELHAQVLAAVYVLCASAPLVILNAAMWGVIAAFQRFRSANLVNVPIMAMYYLGPLLMLRFWDNLAGVMLTLVACRLAMTVAYWRICLDAMPSLRGARPDWRELRPLLRIGGWMSVSNIAWPLLTYMDRFVIASVLSAAATGYYATPFDLVARFSIVTIAVSTSAYPAMAASFRVDPAHTVDLFRHSLLAIATILFPACAATVALAHPLMAAWLGADFAGHAAPVLRWLGIGILAASMDSVVGGLVDGIGRPDVNAKLSLAELAVSVPLLVLLLHGFGIEGAALAWMARCILDLAVRLALAARLYPALRPALASLAPTAAAGLALLALPLLPEGDLARGAAAAAATVAFTAVVLAFALAGTERTQLGAWLRHLAPARLRLQTR